MLKRFLRDSALYSASATLSRGIGIILVPLYTRFLHPSEYGALDLLTVFATLASYLISLEISQGVARVFAEAKTVEEKRSCVSSAAWFATAAYGVFAALASLFPASLAQWLLGSAQWESAARALIFAVAANGVFFMLQDLLRWQLQPLHHAAASITYAVISATVGAVLVITANAGVPGILYGQCAGAVAGIVVSWWNGAAIHWRLQFDGARWREMASYSAPQVISSFAAYFALYVDRLLIKEFMTLDDVGIYGVGARIASVVALLMAGFQSGYIPIVFQNHAAPETPKQMARVFRYFLIMAISLVLLLAGFSKELLWVFTTTQYYGAWNTIPVLAAAILLANMYIFAPGIFIARRTGLVAAVNVGVGLLNVSGNFLLIPLYGTLGAATATLTSSLMAFLVYVYCNRLFYPIPFEWRRIVAAGMLGLAVAAVLMGLQMLDGIAVFMARAGVCIAGATLMALILLDMLELRQLMAKVRRWSTF